MTEGNWITLLAVGEAATLLFVALAAITWYLLRRRNRDRNAAHALVARVRAQEGERQASLAERIAADRGLEAGDADAAAGRIVAAEHRFYDGLIHTYLRRDAEGLREMDERVQALSESYEARTGGPVDEPAADAGEDLPAEPAEAAEAADREPELARLRETIDNLSGELSLYRQALNQLFSEYTKMFGVEVDRDSELTAREILRRLESGQLAGAEEPAADAEPEADEEPDPSADETGADPALGADDVDDILNTYRED